jgi:hypothetical protein
MRVLGEAVHVRAAVLWLAVIGDDGGGGLQWLELRVEAACGGQNPCQFCIDLIGTIVGR